MEIPEFNISRFITFIFLLITFYTTINLFKDQRVIDDLERVKLTNGEAAVKTQAIKYVVVSIIVYALLRLGIYWFWC